MDARLERMADVLVEHSLRVGEGDAVLVAGPLGASEFAVAMQERVIVAGGHPYVRVVPEQLEEALMRLGSSEQLDWVNPTVRRLYETVDCYAALIAPENTCALAATAPEAATRRRRAQQPLQDILERREQAGELRSVVTAVPTHGLAQEADMSVRDYTNLVAAAGWLEGDDPVGEWRTFRERALALAERLNGVGRVRIVAEGTDLELDVGGRTWVPADGTQNFPDGEIYTAPIEDSTSGTIRFPHATIIDGRRIGGISLTFEQGVVVDASAERGEADLLALLDTDDGARRVGELAFGLNERIEVFTGEPLFDEKIAGTVHVALGSAYPECGGTNTSALHWDLVCDLREAGHVELDGELAHGGGRFGEDWF